MFRWRDAADDGERPVTTGSWLILAAVLAIALWLMRKRPSAEEAVTLTIVPGEPEEQTEEKNR